MARSGHRTVSGPGADVARPGARWSPQCVGRPRTSPPPELGADRRRSRCGASGSL